MSTTDTTYQGCANYETWAVGLWLENEIASYTYWLETAAEIWEESESEGCLTRSDNARHALADRLKEEIEDGAPEICGLYSDLLNSALQDVDWDELADDRLAESDDCDGYEGRDAS